MATIEREFIHSPDAKLDYGFDYSKWLEQGETIVTSSWVVDAGLTKSQEQNVSNITSVFVEGGVAASSYKLTNYIVTSAGRKDSRAMKLYCKQNTV